MKEKSRHLKTLMHPSLEMEEFLHRVLDEQMTEEAYLTEVFRRAARKGN